MKKSANMAKRPFSSSYCSTAMVVGLLHLSAGSTFAYTTGANTNAAMMDYDNDNVGNAAGAPIEEQGEDLESWFDVEDPRGSGEVLLLSPFSVCLVIRVIIMVVHFVARRPRRGDTRRWRRERRAHARQCATHNVLEGRRRDTFIIEQGPRDAGREDPTTPASRRHEQPLAVRRESVAITELRVEVERGKLKLAEANHKLSQFSVALHNAKRLVNRLFNTVCGAEQAMIALLMEMNEVHTAISREEDTTVPVSSPDAAGRNLAIGDHRSTNNVQERKIPGGRDMAETRLQKNASDPCQVSDLEICAAKKDGAIGRDDREVKQLTGKLVELLQHVVSLRSTVSRRDRTITVKSREHTEQQRRIVELEAQLARHSKGGGNGDNGNRNGSDEYGTASAAGALEEIYADAPGRRLFSTAVTGVQDRSTRSTHSTLARHHILKCGVTHASIPPPPPPPPSSTAFTHPAPSPQIVPAGATVDNISARKEFPTSGVKKKRPRRPGRKRMMAERLRAEADGKQHHPTVIATAQHLVISEANAHLLPLPSSPCPL